MVVMSSHIRMRCSICGKQYQIERKLFCYYAADQLFFILQWLHVWNKHRDYIFCKSKFLLRMVLEIILYVTLQILDVITGIVWLLLMPLAKFRELMRSNYD